MHLSKACSLSLGACAILVAGTATAADYYVDCSTTPDGVTAAIGTISSTLPNGPNRIFVQGNCSGRAVILGLRNLTIQGDGPGSGIKSPDQNSAAIVNIADSFNIKIWNLTLDGNGYAGGIGVNGSQQVEVNNVTIQNGDAGVLCNNNSYCKISPMGGAVTISHMARYGIAASGNSIVDIGNTGSTLAIEDTGGGIVLGGGSRAYMTGSWSILDMRTDGSGVLADGINLFASELGFRGGCGSGTVSGAKVAINVSDNSTFTYGCPLTIENNKQGLTVRHSSVAHIGGGGTTAIRNNSGGTEAQKWGGVVVTDGSAMTLTAAQISGNQTAGVYVRNNAMATLISNTITGNNGDGVLTTQRSAVWLMENAPANTISGNTGKDLVCTVQGTAFGNASGAGKTACPQFEKIP